MTSNTAIGELHTEVCFYQIRLWYQEAINASGALPNSEAYVSRGSTRETLLISNLLIRCSQRTMLQFLDGVLYKRCRGSL